MQSNEPLAVLVVEDEFLVAFDLATMLESAAFTVLGPVADAAAALALVSQNPPDAALLDVNLGSGKTSYDIARRLSALNIPYVFLSGYDRNQLLEEFQDVRAAASKENRERLDSTLGRIVRMGRAVAVHVLVSTQRPTTDDLPAGTRNLLSQRVALMLRN